MSELTEQQVREGLELAEKATPGPWERCHHLRSAENDQSCKCGYRGSIWGADQEHIVCEMGSDETIPLNEGVRYERSQELRNAAFIVAARTLLPRLCQDWLEMHAELARKDAEIARFLELLTTPEVDSFDTGVPLEAAHQQHRWGVDHDAGKAPADWFWLIGYLAGKALAAHISGNIEKAKHHCISTAAALRNWHAHIRSGESRMRPGINVVEDPNAQD